jgi:Outer membrane protein beta-barrel domain
MRKILFLAVGIFSLSVPAVRAQELPAADLSVGYSYFREGFSNGVNANGGTAAFTGYANRWLGITGDFGAYHASPFGVSANTYTFLVGPRFSYRHSERAAPFAQVLLGGAHLTAGASGISASTSGFAWSAGGGIDLGLSRHLAFRPQFDYIGIHAAGGTLNSARASASIVYRFGSR